MKNVQGRDIRFLLKDPHADRPTLISLVLRYGATRFVYSTGQFIEPQKWDSDAQRAHANQRQRAERQAAETINAHLDRHRAALVQVVAKLQLAGASLSNPILKEHLDKALGKEVKAKPVAAPVRETYLAYIERFATEGEKGTRLNARKVRYSYHTLKGYRRLASQLERYQTDTGKGVEYNDFSMVWYDHFCRYLTARKVSKNYAGALIKDLKILLKQAFEEGLHQNPIFTQRTFRKFAEEVDSIYLNDAELSTLYNLDLSANARLDRVRDLFLIGCYTGLRFSDYNQLHRVNISTDAQVLNVKTQKTGERVWIPINPNVLAILRKYDFEMPRSLTNQKFNQYLKELGKVAGFTTEVEISRTEGGKRADYCVPKCELMTSHTARRSFATNAYLAGLDIVSIMKITGHRSENQFLRYIKVSGEENARRMLMHPHFRGNATTPAVVRPLHQAA